MSDPIADNEHTLEESAQILRQVIGFFSKWKLNPTPLGYYVIYEYMSGQDSQLCEFITDQCEKESLDNVAVKQAYKDYLQNADEEQLGEYRQEMSNLMVRMISQIRTAQGDTRKFYNELKKTDHQLRSESNSDLTSMVKQLLDASREVRSSNEALIASLHKSQEEAENLRKELVRVREEATLDMLTGLLNRRTLEVKAIELMGQPTDHGKTHALLMLDIDHFKNFNDTFGHLVGDEVIKRVSKNIRNHVKGIDIAGRYGGEEFTVLLANIPPEGAVSVAELIRTTTEKLRLRIKNSKQSIPPITISCGVSYLKKGDKLTCLVSRADSALYEAKESGRNRVVVETPPC